MEIDDCIEAIKTVRQMPFIDSRRVGLMGTSHGAQLSSRLVSRVDASGVILCAPAAMDLIEVKKAVVEREEKLVPILMKLVADMEQKYGATAEEIAKDPAKFGYSSALTEVAEVRSPILIINGRNDDNSPVSIIDLYVAKLRAAGKQVDTYLPDNGPHGFYWGHPEIPEMEEAARRAVVFFQKQFSEETSDESAAGNALPAAQSSGQAKATHYQYGPMDWLDPDRTEPAGTRYATFHSQTIDADVSYLVYLPPDYEEQVTVRYPVLYYLHASGGTPRRDGAEIVRRLDKAVRAGRVSPMIVIMPNGLRGNTMYCDSRDGQYPVETVVIDDLIPHVDAAYRTVASREGRAVEGFSMGGFGAAHLGFKYPELFGVVSIQAPPLLGPELTSPLPVRAWSKLFPTAMGGDLEYFQANDPFTLAAKNAGALRDRTLIRIVCHVEDEDWLAPRCEELHQLLMQHMIPHEFYFLSNVKSHNRARVLDTLGDSEFSFFSSALPRWQAPARQTLPAKARSGGPTTTPKTDSRLESCCLNGAGQLSWTCCRLARNTPSSRGTVMPPHNLREPFHDPQFTAHCCPCYDRSETAGDEGLTRRGFLEGVGGLAALGGVALSGLSWSAISAGEPGLPAAAPRRPLVVKPIFTYTTFERRPQTSWRSWGAIQTQPQADEELRRIKSEMNKLQAKADFPLEFLPVTSLHNGSMSGLDDLDTADMLLVYAAGGHQTQMDAIVELGKDTVFFVRHKSGPLYFLYEAIHPWTLRHNTDQLAAKGLDFQDIVVDELDEILWRLRSLCGLHNTVGSRILAVGGPGGWAQPSDVIAKLAKDRWKLDIQTVTYDDLGKLIQAARQDQAAVDLARQRAEAYLKLPGTTLETKRPFVDNAFLLEQVFRGLMRKADCRAITINGCMATIMPISETSACLSLSTLNDDGYQAFCESDFVVIPSGMLLANISGRPMFLNDPTYPHDGVITLAHCTGPRKMDGKTAEPARILTHFESDYGAAPKVEMHKGQKVTNIVPDFKAERWLGFSGEIIDAPFLPICRCQIDIRFDCDTAAVAERMPGFHWMLVYGDYLREAGYALKKIPIKWDCLG